MQLSGYIHEPSAAGVLQALHDRTHGEVKEVQQVARRCKLEAVDRKQLCAFLVQVGLIHSTIEDLKTCMTCFRLSEPAFGAYSLLCHPIGLVVEWHFAEYVHRLELREVATAGTMVRSTQPGSEGSAAQPVHL